MTDTATPKLSDYAQFVPRVGKVPSEHGHNLRWEKDPSALRPRGEIKGDAGFILLDSDPFTCVDLDGCLDDDGNCTPEVYEWVVRLAGYTEVSLSGRGLHIFVAGTLPAAIGKALLPGGQKVEAWSCDRHIALTGKTYRGMQGPIGDRQRVLDDLLKAVGRPTRAKIFTAKGDPALDAEVPEAGSGAHRSHLLGLGRTFYRSGATDLADLVPMLHAAAAKIQDGEPWSDREIAKMAEDTIIFMAAPAAEAGRATAAAAQSRSVLASSIKPKHMRWLWRERVPLGTVSQVGGEGGLGKSQVLTDLAARGSRGTALPGEESGEQFRSLFIGTEDALDSVVVPRLIAAGADLDQIGLWNPELLLRLPSETADLRDEIANTGARLIVVDPITAFMEGRADSNSDKDVQTLLSPLRVLAEATDSAIVIVKHFNKSGGGANARVAGSRTWIDGVRSTLLVFADPEAGPFSDGRLIVGSKTNYGQMARALRFGIVGAQVESGIKTSKIEWRGESDMSADEIAATAQRHVGRPPEAREAAEKWTLDYLGQCESTLVNDLQHAGEAAGHSRATLQSARRRLAEIGVIALEFRGPLSRVQITHR